MFLEDGNHIMKKVEPEDDSDDEPLTLVRPKPKDDISADPSNDVDDNDDFKLPEKPKNNKMKMEMKDAKLTENPHRFNVKSPLEDDNHEEEEEEAKDQEAADDWKEDVIDKPDTQEEIIIVPQTRSARPDEPGMECISIKTDMLPQLQYIQQFDERRFQNSKCKLQDCTFDAKYFFKDSLICQAHRIDKDKHKEAKSIDDIIKEVDIFLKNTYTKYIELICAYNYTFPDNGTGDSCEKIDKTFKKLIKNYTEFDKTYIDSNYTLSYSDYALITCECQRLQKDVGNLIDELGRKCMAMISAKMYERVKEKRAENPLCNPVIFHSKLCTEEDTKVFEDTYGKETIEGKLLEIKHVDKQYDFINNHVQDCYEYHENFLKTCNKLIHLKSVDGQMQRGDKFDVDSSISINMAVQNKSFLDKFSANQLPLICTLQINNFQRLTYDQVSSLLTKIIPSGLKQLILCNNSINKLPLCKRNLDELWAVIENKITDAITIQSFKMLDEEFNKIIESSANLEVISINNCAILPKSENEKDDIRLNLAPLSKFTKLKKLDFSNNMMGKKCLEKICNDIKKRSEADRSGSIAEKLTNLDIHGNQRRNFELKNKVHRRYNYNKMIKKDFPDLELNMNKRDEVSKNQCNPL